MGRITLVVSMDTAWLQSFYCTVVGATKAGKSSLVKRLIKHRREMISPPPTRVYWCYTEKQPMYESLSSDPEITFVEGFPDFSDIGRGSLVVFDDLMLESKNRNNSSVLMTLATRGCHHWGISCIVLTQNAFFGDRTSRINSQYLVLMKNPADKLQVATLARQLFPEDVKYFKQSYDDATREPHGYLFVDLTQSCPEHARLRTNIFPGESTIVYTPINNAAWKCYSQL